MRRLNRKKELKEYVEKKLKDLPKLVAVETRLHVVGESYIKRDSIRQFYPTDSGNSKGLR